MADAQPKKHTFLIYAPDYNDADALSRRLQVRPTHLAEGRVLRQQAILSKYLTYLV